MSDLLNGSDSSFSSLALPCPEEIRFRSTSRPSPLEQEVIDLFEQLGTPLLRYVLSFRLTLHDGEEIVQEVFLALFQHLSKGKSRENLRGWVFRVGHNLALKLKNQNNIRSRFHYTEETSGEALDPRLNPEEDLARIQRQQRLVNVINVLPEQDRYCLYLRAEGLRYREIADTLGISLGAVSISLVRSLGRLTRMDERL